MLVLVVLEGFVILVLVVLVAGLLRSQTEVLRRLQNLGGGDPEHGGARSGRGRAAPSAPVVVPWRTGQPAGGASDVAGTEPSGGQHSVSVVGVSHLTLLAFLSSGCRNCAGFWSRFDDPDLVLPGGDTRLVIVTRDADAESGSDIARLAPGQVPTLMSSEAWGRYDVPAPPYFVLVDGPSSTVIGEGSGSNWDEVAGYLEKAVAG